MKKKMIIWAALVVFAVVSMLSNTVVAGEIKLINPSSNKGTAILKMWNKNEWGYTFTAKPGETVVKNIRNGTYFWYLECPKNVVVGGEVVYRDGKWQIVSKVVVSDDHGTKWVVKEGH